MCHAANIRIVFDVRNRRDDFFEMFSAGARDERLNGTGCKRGHRERVLGR